VTSCLRNMLTSLFEISRRHEISVTCEGARNTPRGHGPCTCTGVPVLGVDRRRLVDELCWSCVNGCCFVLFGDIDKCANIHS